jgi:homoserine kinase type II
MTATTEPLLDRAGEALPLAELARLWPLGGWYEATPVAGGKNEHLLVRAAHGVHYLRRSYRSKAKEELIGQLALMRQLRSRGFPAPEIVPAGAGTDQVEIDGRLWIATRGIEGTPFDDRRPAHLREFGRVLARYHRIVADLPAPSAEPLVLTELRARAARPGADSGLRSRAADLVDRLDTLLPELPRVVVHGGARRGSLVFDGDRITGVLDFDSAHPDVRVLDLAVAVHDAGKVYTVLGEEGHKVALDLDRVSEVLVAYREGVSATAAEVAALPLLLEAKRIKRALGRLDRALAGERLSVNDHAKVTLEDRRLHWLDEHRGALAAACRQALS